MLNQAYSTPGRFVHACLQVTEQVWQPMHLSRFMTMLIWAITRMSVLHLLAGAAPDDGDLVALVPGRAEVVERERQLGVPLAELQRDARPLLLDLTDRAVLATAVQWPARIAAVAGTPDRPYPATALLVRPDGYVAWATSAAAPGPDELDGLRAAAAAWFGTAAPVLAR